MCAQSNPILFSNPFSLLCNALFDTHTHTRTLLDVGCAGDADHSASCALAQSQRTVYANNWCAFGDAATHTRTYAAKRVCYAV